jgi:hypothetical protein
MVVHQYPMVEFKFILVFIAPAYIQVFFKVLFLLKDWLTVIASADDVIRH